jgi:SAM-dependent methyltransferase
MSVADEVREYWDADSVVYDDAAHHHPTGAAEQAAWTAALADLLPPAPGRVLDCGAGTGFLSLTAARLGHRVTALDLSPGMLQRLRAKAEAGGLDIQVVEGPAEQPPPGDFDAVIERHLLWTLPDPAGAMRAWRQVAPTGRLVVIEGLWGSADPLQRLRGVARRLSRRSPWAGSAQLQSGGHHAEYPVALRELMPLGSGTTPAAVTGLMVEAGWPAPQLRRLRDVEWASTLGVGIGQRLLGVPPRFAIVAGP